MRFWSPDAPYRLLFIVFNLTKMMAKILKKPTLGENSNFVASEETPLPTILILTLIPTANPKPPDFGEV